MPIPVPVLYGLFGILGVVGVLAFLFSWSATRGVTIQSCKGDGSCGCDDTKHKKTADKILALIQK